MPASLSLHDLAILPDASPLGVLSSAGWTKRYLSSGRWLGVNNRYNRDIVDQIRSDLKAPSQINDKHLSEYIAASVPIHLLDGWNYLGQALYAQVRGLPDVATHLGYYAELRSAMSLLATQGMSVFNRHHFVVTRDGSLAKLSDRGTHEAVWLYLENWASTPVAADLVGTVLRPLSIGLRDWLDEMPHGGAWKPLGTDLLLNLGLDLKRLADDRSARNEVSYRPTGLRSGATLDASQSAEFLSGTVRALEPSGAGSGFELLDRYLLRRTIERAYKAGTGASHRRRPARYREAIDTMLDATAPSTEMRSATRKFLLREATQGEPVVVAEAAKSDATSHPRHHLQVLGRASLLLRLANRSGTPVPN